MIPKLYEAAPVYMIDGQRLSPEEPEFMDALAAAHASHERPLCLCLIEGVEMYVARLGNGYLVKRMPNSGNRHAPDCPSYEPPPELSGLGQMLGSAISEDPATGVTALRLGFPMLKIGGRSASPSAGDSANSVAADGAKLSLRGLLHYLWDQAELTRWQPAFTGKRSWATVRRHVVAAAQNKVATGGALLDRLYVPELFVVEQRDAINARRVAQLMHAAAAPRATQRLMLLIGEVKEIVPARYGYKALIKHVPDQAFAIDEKLYRRMTRHFERELSLWGAADNVHMVVIATFGMNDAGVPTIEELSLMPTNGQWIPVEDAFELHLVDRLIRDGRRFTKGLRYNLASDAALAAAVLLDTDSSPVGLFIARTESSEPISEFHGGAPWIWRVSRTAMPPLPPADDRRPTADATGVHRAIPSARFAAAPERREAVRRDLSESRWGA